MIWDLKALFLNTDEAWEFLKKNIKEAELFKKDYENKLKNIKNEDFIKAIKEYERLLENQARVLSYAFLLFAKDTNKGSLMAKFEEKAKKSSEALLFFELEFCELDISKAKELLKADKNYSYYLNKLLKNKKHQLSKKEERLIIMLQNTGAAGFSRLFDESFSSFRFKFGEEKIKEEEILSKLYDEDRNIRKKSAKIFSKKLKKKQKLLAFIFNMIKTELRIKSELRGYKDAEEARHLANEIERKSVDALIKSTEESSSLVSQYYKAKQKLLGYKKLKDYDRYAPLGKNIEVSLEDAKKIILQSFEAFSPYFANTAKKAFKEGWIDAKISKNKQAGAFSCSCVKAAHPYILLNYTNTRRDLFTLAHELGHSIHQSLSYEQSFLNQDTALTTAETASIFAEMLVFENLKKKLKNNKEELIALYAAKIEDIFASVYRQINFTTFERRVHAHKDELDAKMINELWLEESKKMFGSSVILSEDYGYWWSYVPHFIHSPFYCYAYAYAQLLVLALFSLYKSGSCKDFESLYIDFLKTGGKKSPKDMIASFGLDINDDKFWQLGLKELKNIVKDFTRLCDDR